MTARKPITDTIKRLRQRRRTDGSWRIWWEPELAVKALGFEVEELDAGKLTWSARRARQLNREVDEARTTGQRTAPKGNRTIAALIGEYRRSRKFRDRKPKTQTDYAGKLRLIEGKWGDDLVVDFTKPVMNQWYETLCETSGSHMAIAMIRMMSILFSHAELIGWRAEGSNPCARLGMSVPKPRKRAASWAEYDALITAADKLGMADMACAIALSALNGARQTDIRTARIAGFRNTAIIVPGAQPRQAMIWELVRSKRDTYGIMEVHPEAAPRVARLIDGADPDQVLLMPDPRNGATYTDDELTKKFAVVRAAAAKSQPQITTLQFRDLRRTFGVWARAGGASKADVGDVLGNSAATDPILGETYMPAQFATANRAINAIQRPAPEKVKR